MASNLIIDEALSQVREALLKSAETTSTYTFSPTTRSVFSPENLNEEVKFLVPIDTPLRNRFSRVQGHGQAANWKKMTSPLHSKMHPTSSTAAGTVTAISFADAGAPGESTQTYAVTSAAYKLLGRKLEVGGLALAASKGRDGQPDMQKSREKIKIYEVMLGEEEITIVGDTNNSSNEYDGLNKQITTNSGNVSFLTASGIGAFCQTLWAYGADPTLLLANARQMQALADDLYKANAIQRVVVTSGAGQGSAVGGLAVDSVVNPVTQSLIKAKPHRYVGFGGLLLTEKSPAGEDWIEVDELLPMSRVDVPSTSFSYVSFVIEALALKVLGEPYQEEFTVGAV